MSLGDAAYVTMMSLTTIGFGDVSPKTGYGRALCVVNGMVGILLLGLLAGIAFSVLRNLKIFRFPGNK